MFNHGRLPSPVQPFIWATYEKLHAFVAGGRNYCESTGRGWRRLGGAWCANVDRDTADIQLHNTRIYTVYPSGRRELDTGGWNDSAMTRMAVEALSAGRLRLMRPALTHRNKSEDPWFASVGKRWAGEADPAVGVWRSSVTIYPDESCAGLCETATVLRPNPEDRKAALATKRRIMALARPTLVLLAGTPHSAGDGRSLRRPSWDLWDFDTDGNPASYFLATSATPRLVHDADELIKAFELWAFGKKNELLFDDFDVMERHHVPVAEAVQELRVC